MPPDERPPGRPIGLQLALTAKTISMAFNAALQTQGGSVPVWLILNALTHERLATQVDLARALGIEGPTLTRHLDRLERTGLVQRLPGDVDRRTQRLEITASGVAAQERIRGAVVQFDRRLRSGLSDDELERLRSLLARLVANVSAEDRDA